MQQDTLSELTERVKTLESQGTVLIIMSAINMFVNVLTVVGAMLFAA